MTTNSNLSNFANIEIVQDFENQCIFGDLVACLSQNLTMNITGSEELYSTLHCYDLSFKIFYAIYLYILHKVCINSNSTRT